MRRAMWVLGVAALVMSGYAAGRAQQKAIDSSVVSAAQSTLAENAAWGRFHAYYEGATPGTAAMLFGTAEVNPGFENHPPHKHADEEVLCLKEGTLEAYEDGQTTRVGPGSVLFFASNHLHGVKNVGTTPATYFIVKWNSPGMLKKKN